MQLARADDLENLTIMTDFSQLRGAIARTSLADSVYETVLEAIVCGQLAAGAEFSEVALAKQLDVSRTPVHEAVRRLAADGLIELTANRRARVVRYTREEIAAIYDMRMLLESAAAERAATRISANALADLRRGIDELDARADAVDWSEQALAFDVRFHAVLAEAAGNDRLCQDIARYRLLVRCLCRMSGTLENLRAALAEHVEILAAIETRDGEAARRAMAEHIARRLEVVLRECDALHLSPQ